MSVSPRRSCSSPSTTSPMTGRAGSSVRCVGAKAGREGAVDRSRQWRRVSAARASCRIRGPRSGRDGLSPRSRAEPELREGLCRPRRGAVRDTVAARRSTRDARSCAQARPARAGLRRHEVRVSVLRACRSEGCERPAGRGLREHPQYVPALLRLCELRAFGMGRLADGVLYCEQALAIDPLSAEARLHLIRNYQQLGGARSG